MSTSMNTSTNTPANPSPQRPDAGSGGRGGRRTGGTRRRVVARLFAVSLFGALALLLSGCVGLTMESTFNEDGSARHSVRTTIDKASLEQLESMTAGFSDFGSDATPEADSGDDSDDLTDTFEISDEDLQALRDAGFDAERIDTEDEVGVMIWRDFPAGTSVTDAFNELMRANTGEGDDGDTDIPLGAIDGLLTRDGDTWTLDLNIDSDSLLQDSEELTGETDDPEATPEIDLEAMGFDLDFDVEYIATFPFEVTETNGTRDTGNANRVRWDLPMTGNTTLNALVNASNGGGSNSSSPLPWIIGGIVLAALGGAFIAVMMARRNSTPAVAGVGAAGPVGTPPTAYTATSAPPADTAPPTVQSPPQATSWTPPASAPTGPWNPPPPNSPPN